MLNVRLGGVVRPMLLTLLVVSLITACSGDSPSTPAPSVVTRVQVTPDSAVVEIGKTQTFSAQALTATGTPVSGRTVQWSSDKQSVATVDGAGVVTAAGAGTAKITATVDGISASVPVRVPERPVLTLAFAQDSLILDRWADTAKAVATVQDQSGAVLTDVSLVWESLNPAVAKVSSTGLVESVALGIGKVRVKASRPGSENVQRELAVHVVAQKNPVCTAPRRITRGSASSAITFGPAEILSLPALAHDGGRSLAADYDGDGDTDIVRLEYSYPSSKTYTGTVTILRNEGGTLVDATSAVLPRRVVPNHPRDFEVADFTGDGVADLYVAQHGFDASPFPGAPNLFLTRQSSQLVDEFSTRFSPASNVAFSHGSSAGDVDCDGDLDLVELNANQNAPHYLFLNNGSGRFVAASLDAFPIGGGGVRWQEASFIDFDADGDPDLYLGSVSGRDGNVDVLLINDGFGRFRQRPGIQLPPPVYTPDHAVNNAKAADFNGDGFEDLFFFEISRPFGGSSVLRLWLNTGKGGFTDASAAWNLPSQCSAEIVEPLHVRDFNRDGWPDVLLPPQCYNLGGAGLLMNTGTGFRFVAFKTIEPWLEHDVGTPIDVDGDGKLDFFFGEHGGNPVLVRGR